MKADYELRTSQYDHPDRPPGQHTNGPSKIFVRRPDGPWYRVRYHAQHKVRLMIATYGFDHFAATHCTLVAQEPPQ